MGGGAGQGGALENSGIREEAGPSSVYSPQGEGSLLVPTHAVPVDGGGTRHGVQMVGAVGQRGDPLAVSLGLLFPGETEGESNPVRPGLCSPSLRTHSHSATVGTTVPGHLHAPVEDIWAFPTPWDASRHLEDTCVRRTQKCQMQGRERWGSLESQHSGGRVRQVDL